jgi:hypothetical protein
MGLAMAKISKNTNNVMNDLFIYWFYPQGRDYALVQDLDLGIKFWLIHWPMWR